MTWPVVAAGAAGVVGGGLALFSGATAKRIEAAVPQDGEIIAVGRDRIHYVDKGAGPPILMIHGLGAQLRSFAGALVDDLARDHRVVLVDRPGSGYSVRGAGVSARLAVQAETMAEFIRALGLERPLVVGHSLGGALALTLAINYPDLLGGLALIAPLTQAQTLDDVPPAFKGLVIRSPTMRRVLSWTVATPLGMLTAEKALREIFAPEPVPADFGTAGGGLLAMRPNNFYATSSDLMALEGELEGIVPSYPSLTIPVSILYPRSDNLLDPSLHGERTAGEIPGAEIELVEGGHMIPFTQPEITARWIRKAAAPLEAPDARRAAG